MRVKGTKLSNRTVALFAAAILLLSSGGFMGVKAAPQIQGQNYEAELQLNSIDVQLLENGDSVKEGKMLAGLNGKAKPGWTYAETIGAENIGSSPAYVRIVIRKYWTDKEGKKATDLKPDLIKLDTSNKWAINEEESTDEMSVYYYKSQLDPRTSAQLVNSVRIDDSVLDDMTTSYEEKDTAQGKVKIYTYEYKYDGYSFNIEAEAQAVQTHNADKAFKSIWGVEKGDVL